MAGVFHSAKWIWTDGEERADDYAEFFSSFIDHSGRAVLRLSCDGDYVLWVNGRYAASNQYGDYEHYKIYDEIDLSDFLHRGENGIKILVWHFGAESQRYLPAKAGLIFEIADGEEILARSDEHTLCRKSAAYRSGYCKKITSQLGFSFCYDATKENAGALSRAVAVEKRCNLFPRPVKKLAVGKRANAEILKSEGNYFLVDLGRESVGYPALEFASETQQKITVFWGEDLQNGHVRGKIDGRDFSYEYIAKRERTNTSIICFGWVAAIWKCMRRDRSI